MRLLVCVLMIAGCAYPAEWGSPVNGLRVSLTAKTDKKGEHMVVVTFQNVQEGREMFLPLGKVGFGKTEFVHLHLIASNGARQVLSFRGEDGIKPGQLFPMIIPLLPGSTYSVPTPLRCWVRRDSTPIEPAQLRGASLVAEVTADARMQRQYVLCYGVQIFWGGRVVSNRIPLWR